jgi:hypothetical protein
MTEPINNKIEARKRTNTDGSADSAEATPTPQQRVVMERYLKQQDTRPAAPRLSVNSKPNQPLEISHRHPADGAGLALAFGTTEGGVASILLDSLINAACNGTPSNPPTEQDVNGVLAAVHGIGAHDEIEAMLAIIRKARNFSYQALPRARNCRFGCDQDAPLPWFFARTHDNRTLHAGTGLGGGRNFRDQPQDIGEQSSRNGDLGHLEGAICAGVAPACRPAFLTETSQSCRGLPIRLDFCRKGRRRSLPRTPRSGQIWLAPAGIWGNAGKDHFL